MNKVTIKEQCSINKTRSVKVGILSDEMGIQLCPDGYDCFGGGNGLVLMEVWEGKLRLVIWADKTQEDPTHIISLERAKLSKSEIAEVAEYKKLTHKLHKSHKKAKPLQEDTQETLMD
jgi:hypothetical protein